MVWAVIDVPRSKAGRGRKAAGLRWERAGGSGSSSVDAAGRRILTDCCAGHSTLEIDWLGSAPGPGVHHPGKLTLLKRTASEEASRRLEDAGYLVVRFGYNSAAWPEVFKACRFACLMF